jgi:hypothetical protein
MQQSNNELDRLFAQYKAALPDQDASANFMPELWRKIEARQSVLLGVKRLTQIFVATAAALCILFVTVLGLPSSSPQDLRGTYVDVLAEAHPVENLAAMGIVPREGLEANRK